MHQLTLQPQLSRRKAKKQDEHRYLSSKDVDLLVETDTMGVLPTGNVAFVYLRNWLRRDTLSDSYRSLCQLPFRNVSHSRRRTLVGSQGWELVLGWWETKLKTHGCGDIYGFLLTPLACAFSEAVKLYLPAVWEAQAERARENEGMLLRLLEQDGILSTITANRNTIFPAHADEGNEPGVSCLTTFGNFTGGLLGFPRLRVAFPCQPGDVLIADTNRELHGNIGGLVGDRISVVFYLRSMD